MTYRPMGCNTLAFQYCQPKVDQICLHLSGRDKNMQCCEINILPDGLYCNNSVHSRTANIKLIKYGNTCTTVCGGWRFSGKKFAREYTCKQHHTLYLNRKDKKESLYLPAICMLLLPEGHSPRTAWRDLSADCSQTEAASPAVATSAQCSTAHSNATIIYQGASLS